MRFSDWMTWTELDSKVPEDPGLFQIKVDRGLLSYPVGKSAMFYYGFAENLGSGLRHFRANVLPLLEIDPQRLRIRWLITKDVETRFQSHLNSFVNGFGAMPRGNELLLQKRGPQEPPTKP